MLPINPIVVLVAAVAAFIIGFLMHGPVAGKLWMRVANVHPTGNEKLTDMFTQMFSNLVVNFITAYALGIVYIFATTSAFTNGPGVFTGLISGLVVWAGFLATSSSIEVIWMGRSVELWLFEAGSSLLVMSTMGVIIGLLN